MLRIIRLLNALVLLYCAISYLLRTPHAILHGDVSVGKGLAFSLAYNYPVVAIDFSIPSLLLPSSDRINLATELHSLALSTGLMPVMGVITNPGHAFLVDSLDMLQPVLNRTPKANERLGNYRVLDLALYNRSQVSALPSLGLLADISGRVGIKLIAGTVFSSVGTDKAAADDLAGISRGATSIVIGGLDPFVNASGVVDVARMHSVPLVTLNGSTLPNALSLIGSVPIPRVDSTEILANMINLINQQSRGLVVVDRPRTSLALESFTLTTYLQSLEAHGMEGSNEYPMQELNRISNETISAIISDVLRQTIRTSARISHCVSYHEQGIRRMAASVFNLIARTAYERDDLDALPFTCRRLPLYDTAEAILYNPIFAGTALIYHMFCSDTLGPLIFRIAYFASYIIAFDSGLALLRRW
ncbi:Indigoidine synthase A like protein [Giardia muris]|uniref:Indigoidine synthase A like protein n=1 Tax=Giardia muris TaxID=5742 RepID=A0A4Z1SZ12_GIAMU|nr:Indigoidine synthase A like protein [Giardia muris]|eukprot:TNJ30005.1 Indigoidine synthase A like protein [Giardia muris]